MVNMSHIADCTGEWCCAFSRSSNHGLQYCIDTSGPAAQQRLALHHSWRRSQDSQSRCTDHPRLQTGSLLSEFIFNIVQSYTEVFYTMQDWPISRN